VRIAWLGTLLAAALLLGGCHDVKYKEEETGYKGIARVDPWLAAERFLTRYDHKVETLSSWRAPRGNEAVWIVPAELISNDTFAHQVDQWVNRTGGHLVCLVEHTSSQNDWNNGGRSYTPLEPAFKRFIENDGFTLVEHFHPDTSKPGASPEVPSKAHFNRRDYEYEPDPDSHWNVSVNGGKEGIIASRHLGNGYLTVVADGRLFRNRWIDARQHAALLKAIVDLSGNLGSIVIVRGATVSLWSLLVERAWAALVGLAVVLVFWLWKNAGRFGPLEAAEPPSPLRGYDHHLEALGDFQWRLDKGAAMLGPLREEILERSHRLMARLGRLDDDIFAVLGERAGIPRERAFRALAEPTPSDVSIFTRTVADLQAILKTLA